MNTRFLNIPKNAINKRFALIIITFTWIILTIFMFILIFKPLTITKIFTENHIKQSTSFLYKANVDKSIVYPSTTLINPDKIMFPKLLKNITVDIDSSIFSQMPISGKIQNKISVILESDYFPRKINLLKGINIYETILNGKDTTKSLGKVKITIDYRNAILHLIDRINKEIGYPINKYRIKISSEIITKNLFFKNKYIPVNNISELNFEYVDGVITRIGEKEYSKEINIDKKNVIQNKINLHFKEISILTARIIVFCFWIIITLLIIYRARDILIFRRKNSLDKNKIDNKYKSRLINLRHDINFKGLLDLPLESFPNLLQISDEKEIPILRFDNITSGKIMYYVADGSCIFSYEYNYSEEDIIINSNSITV